jgi:hypothetical protein
METEKEGWKEGSIREPRSKEESEEVEVRRNGDRMSEEKYGCLST